MCQCVAHGLNGLISSGAMALLIFSSVPDWEKILWSTGVTVYTVITTIIYLKKRRSSARGSTTSQ